MAAAVALVWVVMGQQTFTSRWAHRQDRRIAENRALGPVVLVVGNQKWREPRASRRAVLAGRSRRLRTTGRSAAEDREPREPLADRQPACPRVDEPQAAERRSSSCSNRWQHGGRACTAALTTRRLASLAPSRPRARVRQLLRAHRPQLEFAGGDSSVDVSEARIPRPHRGVSALPGHVARPVFRDRGYRTAFITPSDLTWAGWTTFLGGPRLRDDSRLPPLRVHARRCRRGASKTAAWSTSMLDFIEPRSEPSVLPDGVDAADASSLRADAGSTAARPGARAVAGRLRAGTAT